MSYKYPYGNTEQMNLDWFLKQWETFKADWAEAESGIDGSLDAEIAKVEAAMSELYAARDAAAASATAARQSSLDAAAAQVAAGNSKTAAQAAETAARGSQQAAAESAQEAQASATGAENSALTATQAANTATQQAAGADAAKGAAEAAQQAAEAAQAAAAQSAGQAGQAATAAGDHADDAADSATLAQQAAQDMSNSVTQITTNKNDISVLKTAIEKLDGGRTRNLINPANYYEVPYTGAGITVTVLDDGSIKVVGTPTVYLTLIVIKSNTVLVPNGSYTLTRWENDVRQSVIQSTVTNGYMPQITLSFPSGTAVDSTYKIQFESGNVGTDFIPYSTVIDYIARDDISNLEKSVGNGTAIDNNVISPSKTNFVVEHQGTNLFNPATMATVGDWVINSNGIATKESDQYTTNYGALIIPVSGITAVSIKCASPYTKIYNWFYTDDTGAIITSATPNTAIADGYTITPLDGTGTMLWMSISQYRTTSEGYMIVEGTTAQDYQPYSYYLTIPDLQNGELHALKCPSQYTAVVGDTLQIFYRGLVESVYDDSYDVIVRCDIGQAFERYYQVTPAAGDVGTHNITISVYTPDHSTLIGTDTISLNVVAKMTSPASNAVILYVGDSLAVNGQVPHEFKRRLTGNGGTPSGDGLNNITFIGSKSYDGANFEGIGGWTFNLYNSEGAAEDTNMIITCVNNGKTQDDQHSIYKDTNNIQWKLETIETDQITIIRVSSSGTLQSTGTLTWVSGGVNHDAITYTGSERAPGNPFWDSGENKVDFGTYATRMGVSSIDYVYVLLGWNGGAITETTYKATVTTFINNVKTSFPNAKIVLMGLEIPARDGLAINYSANDMYSDYYAMLDRVFTLNKWYAEIAENTENVYFLNVSGQFDSKYNMQTSTRNVNMRNSTTETYQSNGVHPATSGYMQIADACYRHFNWLIAQ